MANLESQGTNPALLPAVLGGVPVRPQGPPDWPPNDPAIAETLQRAIADGSWGKYHGGHCERLAERLRELHGCEYVVLCSSGTAAVELALRGLKAGSGDEVILAAYDFKGNFTNVLTLGATPVLVDVQCENWMLDAGQLEAAVSEHTTAVIVSHLHGGVAPMPEITDIARRHGVSVIEDAAQCPGARIHGRIAGRWGDVGILSFGGSKLLSAGRGGAVLTDDADIVQRMRLYSHRGNEAYPLSELQAAVLLPQLEELPARNRTRSENVAVLCELLLKRDGLSPFRNAGFKNSGSDSQPGYYKLGLQYDSEAFSGLSRDDFAQAMRAEGIALDAGFRGLHCIHSRRRFQAVGELPVATEADARVLTLHHPVLLEDATAMQQIADAVDKIQQYAERIFSNP